MFTYIDDNKLCFTDRHFLWSLIAVFLMASLATGCRDEDKEDLPSISFVTPVDGQNFLAEDDINNQLPGIQTTVLIVISNFSDSGILSVLHPNDASTEQLVAVSGSGNYLLEDFTLLEGENALSAVLVDGVGRLLDSAAIVVQVSESAASPTMSFVSPATEGQILESEDDLDNNATNGLQFDVVLETQNLPIGSAVVLDVDSLFTVSSSIDAESLVTFPSVTLPETGEDNSLLLTAQTTIEGETFTATRQVSVITGACLIAIDPPLESDACEFDASVADEDPDTEGLQTEVSVTSDCPSVTMTLNGEELDADSTSGDTLSYQVTLEQGQNIIQAQANDPSDNRFGDTGSLFYTVDSIAPVTTLTSPDPSGSLAITVNDDRDDDYDNGIQIDVTGNVQGVETGSEVTVRIDTDAVATAETDAAGDFRAENISFTENGNFILDAISYDSCNNQGQTTPITLNVMIDSQRLTILSPTDGEHLLADEDEDSASGYQRTFEVEAVGLVENESLVMIQCRRPSSPIFNEMGSATWESNPLHINATLSDGEFYCRAFVTEEESTILSSEINLHVDSEGPSIAIVSPVDGSLSNDSVVTLSAFVSGVDSLDVASYAVNDDSFTVAILSDGGFSAENLPVEEGENSFTVNAYDIGGNLASSTVSITSDLTAPSLEFVDPAGAAAILEMEELHGTDAFGDYFYDVVATANEPVQGDLCLAVNSMAEDCVTPTEEGDSWVAIFTNTFLFPGANTLTLSGADLAGNLSVAEQTLSVSSDLPYLAFQSATLYDASDLLAGTVEPLDNSHLNWPHRVDINLVTDKVDAGNLIAFELNGSEVTQVQPGVDGLVTFANITLLEGENTLSAWVVSAGGERDLGFAPDTQVTFDISAPSVAFSDLIDGETITTNNSADANPVMGYQLTTNLETTEVEDGQHLSLLLNCDDVGVNTVYTAPVTDNRASVEVTLPGESASCSFTANVSDLAGNEANGANISLAVDITPPEISMLDPDDGVLLDFNEDVSLDEGIQIDVEARVSGAAGDLLLVDDLGTISLAQAIPSDGEEDIAFEATTLPDGEVTLTVTATDAAGNSASDSVLVIALSDQTTLSFSGLSDDSVLNLATDVSGDDGYQGDIGVIASTPYFGETVYLCLKQESGEEQATNCSDPGYLDIATTTMNGQTATFLDITLPEGEIELSAELTLGDTRAIASPVTVTVDTVRPELISWSLVNDDGAGGLGAGDGLLNLAEAPTGNAVITLQFSGLDDPLGRTVSLYEGLTQIGSVTTDEFDQASFVAALSEGGHELAATVTDNHSNGLASSAPRLNMAIDTVAPVVTWLVPAHDSQILATSDLDTDEEGAQISTSLLVSGVSAGTAVDFTGLTVEGAALETDAAGNIAGLITLPEGDPIVITADVVDAAFNGGTATASILVDVTAPTILIVDPADADPATPGIQVADSDDVTPGFQLNLQVDTTEAEAGQILSVRSSLTGEGLGGIIGQAAVGLVEGANQSASTVLSLNVPGGAQLLTAEVSDSNNNLSISTSLAVEAPVVGCGILFSNPLGNPVLVNGDDYTGDPTTDPFLLDVELMALNIEDCAGAESGATPQLRIGCDTSETDAQCEAACDPRRTALTGCVLSAAFSDSGIASFPSVPFFDGETVTIHSLVDHPGGEGLSITEVKTVMTDLVAPTVTILSPDGSTPISLPATLDPASGWSADGSNMVGTFVFDSPDAIGGSYSAEYNGAPLVDSLGTIENRSIDSATTMLSGVYFPTTDEPLAAEFVITVADAVGNLAQDAVVLNVDGDPPSAPSLTLTPNSDRMRSGQTDLGWTMSLDDSLTGGGDIDHYEIAVAPYDPELDWNDITTWSDPGSVSLISTTLTNDDPRSYTIDGLSFDAFWQVGVRAFDEAGNWSTVSEGVRSTRLERAVIANVDLLYGQDFLSLGDIDSDEDLFDDVIICEDGLVNIILGTDDPESGATIIELTPPESTFGFGGAESLGDINGDGFNDFLIGSYLDDAAYLYFGTDDPAELVLHDVTLQFEAAGSSFDYTGFVTGYSGMGDIYAFEGDGCTAPGSASCYDDFYVSTLILSDSNRPTFSYVVTGRSNDDWFGTGNSPDSSTTPVTLDIAYPLYDAGSDNAYSDNCTNDIITIDGTGLNEAGYAAGSVGAIGDLDQDGWAEFIMTTAYLNNSSHQYIFYGGLLSDCPDSGVTLSAADEIHESTGITSTGFYPALAANSAGGEWLLSHKFDDTVMVFHYDEEVGASVTDGAITRDAAIPDNETLLGQSLSFGGNLDEDILDTTDIVLGGAPNLSQDPPPATPGLVFVMTGINNEPGALGYGETATALLEADDAVESGYGTHVAADLDFDGDDRPDVLVFDPISGNIYLFYGHDPSP